MTLTWWIQLPADGRTVAHSLQLQMLFQGRFTNVAWLAHLSEYGACFPRERGLRATHPVLSQELQNIKEQHSDLEPFPDLKGPTIVQPGPRKQTASPFFLLGVY